MSKKKILLISTGIFIPLAILVIIYYFLGTPHYSLFNIKKAINNRDIDTAQQYIDINSLADQMVDDLLEVVKEQLNNEQETGDDELFGDDFMLGLFELMLPSIKEQATTEFTESFNTYISNSGVDTETQFTMFDGLKQASAFDLILGNNIQIIRNGNVSHLIFKDIENTDGEIYDVKFKMERTFGRQWKITEWENLDDIINNIINTTEYADNLLEE